MVAKCPKNSAMNPTTHLVEEPILNTLQNLDKVLGDAVIFSDSVEDLER
jgi:hypothetical protein